jgi:HEPN domain-containing protein
MDEGRTHEIRQWLLKAGHDLRSARRLFTDDPPLLDTAAYHCQQAAEKALKAFLVLHDIQFSKIHLLPPLVEQCIEVDPAFADLREPAEALTPFATVFRYPGDVLEPEPSDVMEGLAFAEKVVEFVLARMPDEAKENEFE